MVPVEGFSLEENYGENGEDREGDHLLNYLELHQGEVAAVAGVSYLIGGNHE